MAQTTRQWHIGNYGPLGWLETALKAGAVVIGIRAGLAALQSGVIALPEGTPLLQMIVLGVMALLLTIAIADRVIDREIIAMIFIIFNLTSTHYCILKSKFKKSSSFKNMDPKNYFSY